MLKEANTYYTHPPTNTQTNTVTSVGSTEILKVFKYYLNTVSSN